MLKTLRTIGAVGNNGLGVPGVAWDVALMPLKVLDANGQGSVSAAIEAINYAWRNGATISNASWGSSLNSKALEDAIRAAGDAANHLVVAAAGNSAKRLDSPSTDRYYPASYDLPNIIEGDLDDLVGRLLHEHQVDELARLGAT